MKKFHGYSWAGALVLLIFVAGCSTPESLKQGNRLTADAGRDLILQADAIDAQAQVLEAAQPAIASAFHQMAGVVRETAANIIATSELIERRQGPPDQPLAYTRDVHKQTNVKAAQDLDRQEQLQRGLETFFTNTLGKVVDKAIPGAGVVISGVALWLFSAWRKSRKAFAVVASQVEDHPQVKAQIAKYAQAIGEGGLVKKELDAADVSPVPTAPLPPANAATVPAKP